MRRAWLKAAVLSAALTLLPTLAALVVGFGVLVAACEALGDLHGALWWLAVVYLALLAVGVLGFAVNTLRHTHHNDRTDRNEYDDDEYDECVCGCVCGCGCCGPPRPGPASIREELNHPEAWRKRACTAPAALLGGVHLTAIGWAPLLAVVVALLGWLGMDLVAVLTHPARRRVSRALALIKPTRGAEGGR